MGTGCRVLFFSFLDGRSRQLYEEIVRMRRPEECVSRNNAETGRMRRPEECRKQQNSTDV